MSSPSGAQRQDASFVASPSSRLGSFSIDSWVDKRLKDLEESDIIHIKCIITSLPARCRQDIQNILYLRWDKNLDALLTKEKKASPSYSEATHTPEQTPAQELITLLLPDRREGIWDWAWEPLNPCVQTPNEVAEDAGRAVFKACCNIHLGEVVRWMLGDEVGAMTELFRGASKTSKSLQQRYDELGQPKESYKKVVKLLYNRNPLALWIFGSSLGLTSRGPERALHSLIRPIYSIFAESNFQLGHLTILNQRFLYLFIRDSGDWHTLAEDLSLFEQLVSKVEEGPEKLAKYLAERAYDMYAQFKPADFDNKDSIPRSEKTVARHWAQLCYMVRDCVTVRPDLYGLVFDIAWHSRKIRDYFSTTAVLVGLKELNFRHPQSEMWKLIEPSGHYQTIQTEWDEPRPGIPFLVPLLWRHPDELVREVFRFTSYKVWINGASSTRNRTCYTGFALMNLALLKNMSSWIGFIPKTFSIQSIVESPAALYVDTVSEKKFSSSQHGLPPQPVPLPLSSQQELNRNSLRQDVRQLVHSVSERTNPFETTTLGMTTNAIRESYMFVRLSDVTKYGPAVKFKLDGQLGDHQDIASVVELPDESWELVVHRLYFTDLYVELTRQFADCCVNAEYDPTEPSPAELEHYSGKHSLAKQAKRYQFLCRAASMAGSWPIAATYYNLRAEEIRAA